jgi:hypothetical protein
VTDGSSTGTHLFLELIPGPTSSGFDELVSTGEKLFFTVNASPSRELYVSDGSVKGTRQVSLPYTSQLSISNLAATTNGVIFFRENFEHSLLYRGFYRSDGNSVWRLDTPILFDAVLSSYVSGRYFFVDSLAYGRDVYATDADFSSVSDSVLRITDSDDDDRIQVSLKNHKLTVAVGTELKTYDSNLVQSISIVCADGNDRVELSNLVTPAYLYGGKGDDTLVGAIGNDTLTSGPGRNLIRGGEGDDRLNGSASSDSIYGDHGDDRIFGGEADDFLDGGDQVDRIYGGDGNDVISGGSSNDYLFGENGNDTLSGGNQNDILDGGANVDRLYGNAGNDTMYGGGGNDRLEGDDGNDSFRGGAGNDTLFAQDSFADILKGDGGSDSAQFDLLDTPRLSIESTIA